MFVKWLKVSSVSRGEIWSEGMEYDAAKRKSGVGLAAEKAGGVSRQTEDSFFGAPQTLDGVWSGSETRCFPRTGAEGTRRPGSREFTSSGRGLLPRFRWEPTMAGVGGAPLCLDPDPQARPDNQAERHNRHTRPQRLRSVHGCRLHRSEEHTSELQSPM